MTARTGWRLSLDPLGAQDCVYALTSTRSAAQPEQAGVLKDVARLTVAVAPTVPAGSAPSLAAWDGLWRGPLGRLESEERLAVELGQQLLPDRLRTALLAAETAEEHVLTISTRGWLSQVPWDLAALDHTGSVRLCERATVLAAVAPTMQAGRYRIAGRVRGAPVIIVDPGPASGALYAGRRLPTAWSRLAASLAADEEAGANLVSRMLGSVNGAELSRWLLDRPRSQLTYFGHVETGTNRSPAAARLVFADDAIPTERVTAHRWLREPGRWPMPERVALIGCGSDDGAAFERSGLPVAAINAGANLVTATRWTLPNDDPRTPRGGDGATTELGVAVARAHAAASPLQALRRWQLARLADWRAGGQQRDSPLLWASLVNYVAG